MGNRLPDGRVELLSRAIARLDCPLVAFIAALQSFLLCLSGTRITFENCIFAKITPQHYSLQYQIQSRDYITLGSPDIAGFLQQGTNTGSYIQTWDRNSLSRPRSNRRKILHHIWWIVCSFRCMHNLDEKQSVSSICCCFRLLRVQRRGFICFRLRTRCYHTQSKSENIERFQ